MLAPLIPPKLLARSRVSIRAPALGPRATGQAVAWRWRSTRMLIECRADHRTRNHPTGERTLFRCTPGQKNAPQADHSQKNRHLHLHEIPPIKNSETKNRCDHPRCTSGFSKEQKIHQSKIAYSHTFVNKIWTFDSSSNFRLLTFNFVLATLNMFLFISIDF